jgi:hypothetical protein
MQKGLADEVRMMQRKQITEWRGEYGRNGKH